MILLDWTRLGHSYCLGGVVVDDLTMHIVRPLPVRHRGAPSATVGWSPYMLEGYSRWEIFELLGPETSAPSPPHLEDVWVRSLRPRRQSASAEQRRSILAATAATSSSALFGGALMLTRSAGYLAPNTGVRSLATLIVPAATIRFAGSWRAGTPEPSIRVTLPILELGERVLPVKDHHLLCRGEQAGHDIEAQIRRLNELVQAMGERVAVRLGLSRSFKSGNDDEPGQCWLMADGFFALADPQS
jgi:hypothetical protein